MRDCCQLAPAQDMRICYHCDQAGHMKSICVLLDAKPVQAPVPATLRIIDGSHGRADPLRAWGCAFQLTTEEARTTPDVVAGMFISFIFLIIYVLCLCVCTYVRYVLSELLTCISII